MLECCKKMQIPQEIAQWLDGRDAFESIMRLQGKKYREITSRRTIQVNLGNDSYFVKQHFGVGWREILKNLLVFRLPIVSAMTEVNAIRRFDDIGIPTTPLVAYGKRGCNPATMQSFVLTRDLGNIVSLETLCSNWRNNPPDARFKRGLIIKAAEIARNLHENGMNHRDFYICHFCLDNERLAKHEIYLYLIDLHRVGMRRKISRMARTKDMAGLYFSAMDIGLTKRDYLRFLRVYLGGLHKLDVRFWQKVESRAARLYYKFHRKLPGLIHW